MSTTDPEGLFFSRNKYILIIKYVDEIPAKKSVSEDTVTTESPIHQPKPTKSPRMTTFRPKTSETKNKNKKKKGDFKHTDLHLIYISI